MVIDTGYTNLLVNNKNFLATDFKNIVFIQSEQCIYTYTNIYPEPVKYKNDTINYIRDVEAVVHPYGDKKDIKIIQDMLDTKSIHYRGFIAFKNSNMADMFKIIKKLEDINYCKLCHINNIGDIEIYINHKRKTLLYCTVDCELNKIEIEI